MPSHKIALAAMSFALVLMIGTATFAQSSTTTAPPTITPPPQGSSMSGPADGARHHGDPAMHAAWEACKATVAKDAQGHPDHEAMKACLKSKGFTPPPHNAGGPPPGGMGAGGPPRDQLQQIRVSWRL